MGGSNGNDTQAYSKVLTLGSVHAKIQLGITICRFIELSNPTKETTDLVTFTEEIINGNFHFLCSELTNVALELCLTMRLLVFCKSSVSTLKK